jgi:hypothetical protein
MHMQAFSSNGICDVFYEGNKNDLFIEYKYIPKWEGKRKVPISMLSTAQVVWITRRINNNRPVAVVIGAEDGMGIILANSDIINPPDIKHIKVLTPKQIAEYIVNVTMATSNVSSSI